METFYALLAICTGNSPATAEFPAKASDAELWCFLWSALEKNGWVNNREAGDLRRHQAHYDVIVMGKDKGKPTRKWAIQMPTQLCIGMESEQLSIVVSCAGRILASHVWNGCIQDLEIFHNIYLVFHYVSRLYVLIFINIILHVYCLAFICVDIHQHYITRVLLILKVGIL